MGPDWFSEVANGSMATVRQRMVRRQRAFAREWNRRDFDPGDALITAFAAQLSAASERTRRLPGAIARDVLSVAGVTRRESIPARVPVLFRCTPVTPSGEPSSGLTIPDGYELEARLGSADPVPFKVEGITGVIVADTVTAAVESPRSVVAVSGAALSKGTATVLPFGQPAKVGNALWIGVEGPIGVGTLNFGFELADPISGVARSQVKLIWEVLTAGGFEPTSVVVDLTDGFSRSGVVVVKAPAQWEPIAVPRLVGTVALHWLRVRLVQGAFSRPPVITGLKPNVGTVIAARVVRDLVLEPIVDPLLPDERTYVLPDVPVRPESVRVEVSASDRRDDLEAAADWSAWRRVNSLADARPDEPVFVVDADTGRLTFGSGVNGRPLPEGFRNVRVAFEVPGGGASQVLKGQRFEGRSPLPGLIEIVAVSPSSGGVDPSPIDGGDIASDRLLATFGGRVMRSQGRAVTPGDLEHLVPSAPGASIDRAIAVRGIRLDGHADRRTTAVFLLRAAPIPGLNPVPDAGSMSAVERYLRRVGPPGLRVVAGPPQFVAIAVAGTISITDDVEPGTVIVQIAETLNRYLDPLAGRGGDGWRVGATVGHSELVDVVAQVDGVSLVDSLTLIAGAERAAPCADVVLGPAAVPSPGSHLIDVRVGT
jgi:hypothetical protein